MKIQNTKYESDVISDHFVPSATTTEDSSVTKSLLYVSYSTVPCYNVE